MNQPDWIGQTLGGRYQIQELIGQGGMSSVFKAFDPNLQRVVAVKLIHPHLSNDPRFTARFEDEARAVARLRHPNIVQVYDFNHDGAALLHGAGVRPRPDAPGFAEPAERDRRAPATG